MSIADWLQRHGILADDATSERLSRVDEELDAIERDRQAQIEATRERRAGIVRGLRPSDARRWEDATD